MAIRIEDEYAQSVAADASYPGGSFKNVSTPGGSDGTPLEKAWANDFLGARDAILAAAGVGYSGAPDTAVASDLLDALNTLFVAVVDAVSAATANKVVKRDANGRAKVAAPVASDDIAIKGTVDTHANLTAPHGAATVATANRLALRDAGGRLEAARGVSGDDLVNFGQFGTTLGTSGYQDLPGGFIMQWGEAPSSVVGNGATNAVTFTYEKPFPNAALFALPGFITPHGGCAIGSDAPGLSSVTIWYANLSGGTRTLQGRVLVIGH